MTDTTAIIATPAKLRDGSWGARVKGSIQQGATITIETRGGKRWQATVARVVWSGDGVTLVATQSADRPARGRNYDPDRFNGYGAPRGGYRKACITGGNCSSFGSGKSCGGHDCDGY